MSLFCIDCFVLCSSKAKTVHREYTTEFTTSIDDFSGTSLVKGVPFSRQARDAPCMTGQGVDYMISQATKSQDEMHPLARQKICNEGREKRVEALHRKRRPRVGRL